MLHFFCRCICIALICLCHQSVFASQPITMDLQNANLSDSIRLLAKFIHANVVISSSVTGKAALHLKDVTPEEAFNLLLTTHGLGKIQLNNSWFVAPQAELIKRQTEELKWLEVKEAALPLFIECWQIKYAKAEEIVRLLKDEQTSVTSERGSVREDSRSNKICIQDVRERIQALRRLITQLDIPVQQVSIEARLVSVDSDYERELGIHFSNEPAGATPMAAGQYSLAVVKLADRSILDVRLAALENAGHAELISSPSLFAANQQTASIEAGEEVPYQEVSEGGGTATVFKKAVLGLKVTPQVLPNNKVLLQLQINQDRPSNKLVLGVPTISTRRIMTNVLVKNHQTIVLGGIYETNRENGELGLPFISRIPVLGWLFKQQNMRENKRELLIFVTTKIIKQTL